MEIGVHFTFGPYSVPAFDDATGIGIRRLKRGSEWYMQRLTIPEGGYYKISGSKDTKEYHKETYGDGVGYQDFLSMLEVNPNIESWIVMAKNAGAKYAVITAKHHDGFCMWKPCSSSNGFQPNSDYVGMFRDACRKHGLRFGVHYSWMEFSLKYNIKYVTDYVVSQINELYSRYNPDIWWFSGDFTMESKTVKKHTYDIVNFIKKYSPLAEINNNIGFGNTNYTYKVFVDIPKDMQHEEWEYIATIGKSYGYNHQQKDEDYTTVNGLRLQYFNVQIKNKAPKCKFLINLAVDANGNIDRRESDVFTSFCQTLI